MTSSIEMSARPNSERLAAIFGILMLIFCFCYFFELASFPFSLDEEWAALRKDPTVWIGQGRWGSFLIEKYILPQAAIPVVPQLMFGLGCAASFLMVLRALGRDIFNLSVADYASFVFFCAFPAWFFIVEFSSNIGSVGLGMTSGTYGAYLAMTSERAKGGLSGVLLLLLVSLLGAFAIATYQTLLFYLFCICAGCLIGRSLHQEGSVDRWLLLKAALFLIGSVAFYAVVSALFKNLYSIQETYTNAFFHLDYFLADPVQAMIKTATEGAAFYGVVEAVYHSPVWALPIVILAGAIGLAVDGRLHAFGRLAVLAGAAAILAAPFALNPFFPGLVLGRTMVAVPVAAWLLCYFGLNSPHHVVRAATSVALAVAIAQIVVLQNRSQASGYFLAKHDLLVATSIYDRLGNSPAFRKGTRYAIAVYGGRTYRTVFPVPATSNAAASFLGPFVGNSQRVLSYLKIVGLEGLRPATQAELDAVVVRLSKMPIWPAAGSVVLENGVLLVRLARDPGPTETESLKRVGAL
ncbi:MAG: glucosyltransferase domain-containing protein [Rhizobiaceae bacterium]